jgi:hypothetical protein
MNNFDKILNRLNKIPNINLDRPHYIQPEDSMTYRSSRILLILGCLNTANGLSKESLACVDFLLKNPFYQCKFIFEYFKENPTNLIKKWSKFSQEELPEVNLNILQYKNIPWDLRFNDIFMFLYSRKLIEFIGKDKKRAKITEKGREIYSLLSDILITEKKFLSIFGKRMQEEKLKEIITEVIPDSYWRRNEKIICQ